MSINQASRMPNGIRRALLILLVGLMAAVTTESVIANEPHELAAEPAAEHLSESFLLFLAEGFVAEGEWIDPMMMQRVSDEALGKETATLKDTEKPSDDSQKYNPDDQ